MSMERLIGTRYVVPLREGGSLPAVVETVQADETTPGGAFVVKFHGAGQGAKALIAEALVAGLAQALGLPMPTPAIITLEDGFGRAEPDPEIQDILRGSVGENFGLAYLSGALAYDPGADRGIDEDLAAGIVWLDALTTNVDRTARNTNMLRWHDQLWLIDHGAALYVHHRWDGWRDRDPIAVPADQGSRAAGASRRPGRGRRPAATAAHRRRAARDRGRSARTSGSAARSSSRAWPSIARRT